MYFHVWEIMFKVINCCMVCNSEGLETIQLSIKKEAVKNFIVCPFNGTLCKGKMNEKTLCTLQGKDRSGKAKCAVCGKDR